MMWYEPLLEKLWKHYQTHHKDLQMYIVSDEMNLAEQYLLYTKFPHADIEYLCCQFCDYKIGFVVNYDLTTQQEQ